jgi:hypothetical protein
MAQRVLVTVRSVRNRTGDRPRICRQWSVGLRLRHRCKSAQCACWRNHPFEDRHLRRVEAWDVERMVANVRRHWAALTCWSQCGHCRSYGDPKDIAALAVFLASDAAKSISGLTGQMLPIDNDMQQAS